MTTPSLTAWPFFASGDMASASDAAEDREGAGISPLAFCSKAERWAWAEIRAGRCADFDARYGVLDPRDPDGWSEVRRIRPAFLRTVLFDKTLQREIPCKGLRILGAWFCEPLVLASAEVGHNLALERSRFEGGADLRGLGARGTLSFSGSYFAEALDMNGLTVDQSLDASGGLYASGAVLLGARVRGQVVLAGSHFKGPLDMEGLEAGGGIQMNDGAEFAAVILADAKVGAGLSMADAAFAGEVDLEGIHVRRGLSMRQAVFAKAVRLDCARIGEDLDLCGAELVSLDLSETRVEGNLRLGSHERDTASWAPGALLNLRNARAKAVQACQDAWPNRLALNGFTYRRFGGSAAAAPRRLVWFMNWLEKDPDRMLQPYQQLAAALRVGGESGKADAILYVGRERDRRLAGRAKKSWLTLLNYTVGYGLGRGYFRSAWWIAGLTVLGALVLSQCSGAEGRGAAWLLSCSLDLLFPFFEFGDGHYEFLRSITGAPKLYFYFHQFFGFALAAILLAGASGLTQERLKRDG